MAAAVSDDLGEGVGVVRSWRFGMIMADVMYDGELKPLTRYVYAILTTYAGADRSVWPSRSRIATDSGLSLTTVRGALDELEAAGIIVRERRTGPSGVDRTSMIQLVDAPEGRGRHTPPRRGRHTPPEGAPHDRGGGATRPLVGGATRPQNIREENIRAGAREEPVDLGLVTDTICLDCRCLHSGGETCKQAADRRAQAAFVARDGIAAVREQLRKAVTRDPG